MRINVYIVCHAIRALQDRDGDSRRSRSGRRHSPSLSRSRSRSPRRSEKSKEEREEAAKRAAIDELTRDQRTVFVNQLTMKVGLFLCLCLSVSVSVCIWFFFVLVIPWGAAGVPLELFFFRPNFFPN